MGLFVFGRVIRSLFLACLGAVAGLGLLAFADAAKKRKVFLVGNAEVNRQLYYRLIGRDKLQGHPSACKSWASSDGAFIHRLRASIGTPLAYRWSTEVYQNAF